MRLVNVVPHAGAISEIRTFECRVCKIVVTEPGPAPVQME